MSSDLFYDTCNMSCNKLQVGLEVKICIVQLDLFMIRASHEL
jgi:hypothetical protein